MYKVCGLVVIGGPVTGQVLYAILHARNFTTKEAHAEGSMTMLT